MYVRDVGTGPPIIVVHGGPDFDHQYLLPEMDTLADAFHLVYYDQRGRGRSFAGQRPDDIDITSEVEDLDSVRERFGFDRVAVLGHSWGGLLAATYAIRQARSRVAPHPDELRAAVARGRCRVSRAPQQHSVARAARANGRLAIEPRVRTR